jgi:hypothetical protein
MALMEFIMGRWATCKLREDEESLVDRLHPQWLVIGDNRRFAEELLKFARTLKIKKPSSKSAITRGTPFTDALSKLPPFEASVRFQNIAYVFDKRILLKVSNLDPELGALIFIEGLQGTGLKGGNHV